MKYVKSNKYGKYEIYKSVDGVLKYFGSFDTLIEAKKFRDNAIKNDWRVEPALKNSKYSDKDMTYITFSKLNNKFKIQKTIGGFVVHFGYYPDLETAKRYRDYFVKTDWKVSYENVKDDVVNINKTVKKVEKTCMVSFIDKLVNYFKGLFGEV